MERKIDMRRTMLVAACLLSSLFVNSCATGGGTRYAMLVDVDILNDNEIGLFLKSQNADIERREDGSVVIHNTAQTRDVLIRLLRLLRGRMTVIANNLANVNTTNAVSYVENDVKKYIPYRRRVFKIRCDGTGRVEDDLSDYLVQYNPKHPHADGDGKLLRPNIVPEVEMIDINIAFRFYEAIMNILKKFDPSIVDPDEHLTFPLRILGTP